MTKKLMHWLGLTGIIALLSYAEAVCFSPLAYPDYNRLSQAVSDLSAENAPSRMLWNQLAALNGACSVVCVTCVSVFVSENKTNTRLLHVGIYLFTIMNWISKIGYEMFPLSDSGKEFTSPQETMHIVVTAAVVLLSIVSLVLILRQASGKQASGAWASGLVPPLP